jgi:hypothetical protein
MAGENDSFPLRRNASAIFGSCLKNAHFWWFLFREHDEPMPDPTMLDELQKELKRPATLVAMLIAIVSIFVGVATSLFFYSKSIRAGAVFYKVEQLLAFDQSTVGHKAEGQDGSLPLYAVDGDGNILNENVYVANIKIWNGGNDEIRSNDVRKEFTISLENESRFFNIKMFNQTNSNISGFYIDKQNIIKWGHFDPGDGFVLKLLYASKDKKRVIVGGHAINVSGPSDVDEIQSGLDSKVMEFFVFLIGLIVIVPVAYIFIIDIRNKRLSKDGIIVFAKGLLSSLVIPGVVVLSVLAFEFVHQHIWSMLGFASIPPF